MRYVGVEFNVNNLALYFFKMSQTLGSSGSSHNHLDIFRERLRQPKSNIGLFSSLAVNKLVDSLDDDDDLLVDFLGTVDNQLLFNLSTADIQPVGKKFSDIFLKQVHVVFKFKSFSELDYDSVERVKIIAIITTVAGKVNN